MTKQKILVVDDDSNLVQALRLRLIANDYDIAVAGDGYAAIATAQKEQPDLVILDLGLPAGDGFLVLDRLRQRPNLEMVPVIILSARDAETNEDRALMAGAAAYFQKPADNDELLQMIRVNLPPSTAVQTSMA
jgi:DNA-binding response OmpR family regulator